MKRFMDWLSNVLAPATKRVFSQPYIAAVSSAMQKILPFILTGSVIYIYNVFRAFIPALPNFDVIINYTFRFLALIVAFVVASQLMEKLNLQKYLVNAGLTAILVFMIFIVPTYDESGAIIMFTYARFGPAAMFVAIVAGVMVGFIYHMYSKLHFLENNDTLPDFVAEWFNNILPILVSIAISVLLVFKAEIDIYQVIINAFMPIQKFLLSLPGMLTLSFLQVFFFSLGISPWVWGAIRNPVFATALAANIAAVAAGNSPEYIVTYETMFAIGLITMGGQGAPLPLNLLMCRSKSKRLKTMGRICIGPSIFNISEPLMYGTPVVFNPMLMVPMWINALVGPIIVWIAMSMGFLNIPAMSLQVSQIPAPISTVIVTQDMRGLLWFAILMVVYLVIWYPFFKVYEKEEMEKEAAV